jgi:hypothetical protein
MATVRKSSEAGPGINPCLFETMFMESYGVTGILTFEASLVLLGVAIRYPRFYYIDLGGNPGYFAYSK